METNPTREQLWDSVETIDRRILELKNWIHLLQLQKLGLLVELGFNENSNV